jgi:hypothetical protein
VFRAVTTIEADEATVSSDFLKMEHEIKRKNTERERERERERAPTQLQLVWFIDHDTLSWLFVHFKSLLSVLETVQSKYKGQAAADASSYIKLCYSKSILSWLQLC